MPVFTTVRRLGAAAGRHALLALFVIALAVGAYLAAADTPEVCSRPNELEACG